MVKNTVIAVSHLIFFKIYFLLEDNCFTILCWFLPHINVNQPWYTYVSTLVNLPPTSHPSHLSRLSQSTRFELPANSYWLSILHMIMHKFQCYSINLYPPLLPLCPQACPPCLHLICCPANRFIGPIFLDSIYMC